MSSTTPLILADGITKRFGANQVLTRVSLDVVERDVVCVVGPSGSGKTTLLRCLALLEEPSEGRVVMEGVAISTPSPNKQVKAAGRAVRSEIGMVFQHFNLWPHMSVLQNVIEAPIRVKKMPRDQAVAVAEALLKGDASHTALSTPFLAEVKRPGYVQHATYKMDRATCNM